jgi:hypothetical protein
MALYVALLKVKIFPKKSYKVNINGVGEKEIIKIK